MKKVNFDKRQKLATKRKKPTFQFAFFIVVLIVLVTLALNYHQELFKLSEEEIKTLTLILSITIVSLACILFLALLVLMRPSAILESDLENIYHNRTSKKVTVIPFLEIKRVSFRLKSRKKAKRTHGTLIIRAAKRYKIKNVKYVDAVKNDIEHLISRQQAYLKGVEVGKRQLQAI